MVGLVVRRRRVSLQGLSAGLTEQAQLWRRLAVRNKMRTGKVLRPESCQGSQTEREDQQEQQDTSQSLHVRPILHSGQTKPLSCYTFREVQVSSYNALL